MKLVYLYVENPVAGVIGRNLNFSSRYDIHMDKKLEDGGRMEFYLQLSKKPFYDDIIYGKNVEVFGIVGENGTGKSSVLDYIRRLHYDCENFANEIGFAFSIWEKDGEFILFKNPFLDKVVLINLRDIDSGEEICLTNRECIDSHTGIVYYSDIVDEKYVYNKFNDKCIDKQMFREQKNVSTSYYISEIFVPASTVRFKKNNLQTLRNHFYNEVERELFFIWDISEKGEKFRNWFHIPNRIEMLLILTNFNVIEKEILENSLSDYTSDLHHVSNGSLLETSFIRIAKLLKEEYEILKSVSHVMRNGNRYDIDCDGTLVEMRLGYNCFIDMLCYLKENSDEEVKGELDYIFDDIIQEVEELFPRYPKEVFGRGNFSKIRNFNNMLIDVLCHNIKYEYDLMDYTLFMDEFKKFFSKNNFEMKLEEDTGQKVLHIELPIEDVNYRNALFNLLQGYKNLSYNNWLQFSWGMSSGEKSRIILFSRFYDVLKRVKEGDSLLLLDELDYYMHPSWQQNILSEFIQFLNIMFSEQRFQIIFTTHSPITLSDIRKDNILFLDNASNEEKHDNNMEETFAANIASLYLSAFSMRSGSIGSIGATFFKKVLCSLNKIKGDSKQKKIEDRQEKFLSDFYDIAIEEIKGVNYEIEIRRIRQLIENIGEDIYRIKLLERFDACNLLSEETTMEKEIEQLIQLYGREDILKYMNKC